jgi:hypothetical protein
MRAPGSAAIRLECAQLSWVIIIKERERKKQRHEQPFLKARKRFFYLSKYTYIMTGGTCGGARARPASLWGKEKKKMVADGIQLVSVFLLLGWMDSYPEGVSSIPPHIHTYAHAHTYTHSQNKLCALSRPRPLATLISLGPPRLRPP